MKQKPTPKPHWRNTSAVTVSPGGARIQFETGVPGVTDVTVSVFHSMFEGNAPAPWYYSIRWTEYDLVCEIDVDAPNNIYWCNMDEAKAAALAQCVRRRILKKGQVQ